MRTAILEDALVHLFEACAHRKFGAVNRLFLHWEREHDARAAKPDVRRVRLSIRGGSP